MKGAIKEINELDEKYDLFWVEEPVYADNYSGYNRISNACDTRIVGGEREYTIYGFQYFVEHGNVDGIQPDVGTAGGISQMDEIATLAKTRGIPVYLQHDGRMPVPEMGCLYSNIDDLQFDSLIIKFVSVRVTNHIGVEAALDFINILFVLQILDDETNSSQDGGKTADQESHN